MSMEIAAVINRNSPRLRDHHLGAASSVEQLCLSENEADAEAFIRSAIARGVGGLVIGGGDGTLAHALTTLSKVTGDDARFPVLGLIRLGTGNAAAEAFSAPRATPSSIESLVARLRSGESGAQLRTLSADGRLGCFAGFGVDAQLLEDHSRSNAWLLKVGLAPLARGAFSYVISTVTRSLPRFALEQRRTATAINRGQARAAVGGHLSGLALATGRRLWSGQCTLAACATIPTFGFGLRMFALANKHPGRFQLRLSDASLFDILRNTPAAFRGTYFSDNVHDFLCDRVELTMSEPAPFELNGDLLGTFDCVEISLGPCFELLT